jgi:hypothetical protein
LSIVLLVKGNRVFDVEMCTHRCALIFPYSFELLPAGAACLDMHAIRLVGGVVADQVMGICVTGYINYQLDSTTKLSDGVGDRLPTVNSPQRLLAGAKSKLPPCLYLKATPRFHVNPHEVIWSVSLRCRRIEVNSFICCVFSI